MGRFSIIPYSLLPVETLENRVVLTPGQVLFIVKLEFEYKRWSKLLDGFHWAGIVCMVITYSRVWMNRVRLPILLVVS